MIELRKNQLRFSFPEVHARAELTIEFQRTLRIPDDAKTYPLPPGLGRFPLEHVDDHAANVSERWLEHGGVMLPMYQAEAMWLNFESKRIAGYSVEYPFAIKVATGKQCAVSGKTWTEGLHGRPQNYLVVPLQPWLDGYAVEKGVIRQFVAMPLGAGYSAEEQLTGEARYGGLQLAVYPMKREVFEQRFQPTVMRRSRSRADLTSSSYCLDFDMGLAPGGRMRQEIFEDPYLIDDWDLNATSRCFVHLCNSLVWQSITGALPPHPAPTAKHYTKAGLPWFDYYDDQATAVAGSAILKGLESVAQKDKKMGGHVLAENETVAPGNVIVYRNGLTKYQVREWVG